MALRCKVNILSKLAILKELDLGGERLKYWTSYDSLAYKEAKTTRFSGLTVFLFHGIWEHCYREDTTR